MNASFSWHALHEQASHQNLKRIAEIKRPVGEQYTLVHLIANINLKSVMFCIRNSSVEV
jgi:hypothetical protein